VKAVVISMNLSDSEVTHLAEWAQYLTAQAASDVGVRLHSRNNLLLKSPTKYICILIHFPLNPFRTVFNLLADLSVAVPSFWRFSFF
jgi:hypothetical protein